jgi:hypothetical protein
VAKRSTELEITRSYEPNDAAMRELLRILIVDTRPSADKPNIVVRHEQPIAKRSEGETE